MLEWTGERYVPWLEEPSIGYEHLHRYAYASQYVRNKRVLDLASGEGYGSHLLAQTARLVVGIDCDQTAIRHARDKYTKDNLEFILGSIIDIPIQEQHRFDVIVCFEAIEHIEEHDRLLSEVKRLLTTDGVFLVSTPDKKAYSDDPHFQNPFHVKELYLEDFKKLFASYFTNTRFLGQRIYCVSNIWPLTPGQESSHSKFLIARESREFVFVDQAQQLPLYVVAVGSDDAKNLRGDTSILIDVANELLTKREESLRQTLSVYNTLQSSHQLLEQALSQKEEQIVGLVQENETFRQTLKRRDRTLDSLNAQLNALQAALADREQQLNVIRANLGWKVLSAYGRLKNKLLPHGSRRRRLYSTTTRAVATLGSEGPRGLVRKAANHWAKEETAPANAEAVFCNVCGWQGEQFLGYRHSESLICPICGSVSRDRLLYEALLNHLREVCQVNKQFLLDNVRLPYTIVETSPRLSNPILNNRYVERMREICDHYIDTDFTMENLKAGRFEDLQNLTFPANSVDFILSSHVLEHVPDDRRALAEVFRVLKAGGVAYFQMPLQTFHTYIPETEEYHEDRALVMRRNGWDVADKMKEAGFTVSILVCDELFLCFESFPSRDFLIFDEVMFYTKYGSQKDAILNYPFLNFVSRERQMTLSIYPFGAHEVFLCHKRSTDAGGADIGKGRSLE